MIVEIWAEAGRNARVEELMRAHRRRRARQAIERLDRRGQGGRRRVAQRSTRALPRGSFSPSSAGLFKRMAIEPDFDRGAETAMAYGVLRALFDGAIAPGEEDLSQ